MGFFRYQTKKEWADPCWVPQSGGLALTNQAFRTHLRQPLRKWLSIGLSGSSNGCVNLKYNVLLIIGNITIK